MSYIGRWRSVASVAVLGLLALGLAGCSGDPFHLMPEAASPEAEEVDRLTYLILYVTGVTFFGVQGLLVWFLFRHRAKEGVRAKHTHGNHAVELTWTVAPALILVLLAVYQADLWVELKSKTPEDNAGAVPVQIFAKQFEWNFRYPGPDGEFATADDLVTTGSLVMPVDRPANAVLRSMDVLHSLWMPALRFKQDAVPGLSTAIWFRATKKSADRRPVKDREGVEHQLDYWDIVCAELCGITHSAMSARMYVVSNEDFENWLAGKPTSVELPPHFKIDLTKAEAFMSVQEQIWRRWAWQDDVSIKGPPRWQRNPYGEDDLGADAGGDDEEDDF